MVLLHHGSCSCWFQGELRQNCLTPPFHPMVFAGGELSRMRPREFQAHHSPLPREPEDRKSARDRAPNRAHGMDQLSPTTYPRTTSHKPEAKKKQPVVLHVLSHHPTTHIPNPTRAPRAHLDPAAPGLELVDPGNEARQPSHAEPKAKAKNGYGHGTQNRFGIPCWLVGECTTHVGFYFSGLNRMFTGGTGVWTHGHIWTIKRQANW